MHPRLSRWIRFRRSECNSTFVEAAHRKQFPCATSFSLFSTARIYIIYIAIGVVGFSRLWRLCAFWRSIAEVELITNKESITLTRCLFPLCCRQNCINFNVSPLFLFVVISTGVDCLSRVWRGVVQGQICCWDKVDSRRKIKRGTHSFVARHYGNVM